MEKNYYYEYKVNFYNDFYEKEEERYGVTYADSYSKAMENIAAYYGDMSINDVRIFALDMETVYEFDTDFTNIHTTVTEQNLN